MLTRPHSSQHGALYQQSNVPAWLNAALNADQPYSPPCIQQLDSIILHKLRPHHAELSAALLISIAASKRASCIFSPSTPVSRQLILSMKYDCQTEIALCHNTRVADILPCQSIFSFNDFPQIFFSPTEARMPHGYLPPGLTPHQTAAGNMNQR